MNGSEAFSELVNYYKLPDEAAEDILSAAFWIDHVTEIRIRYTETETLLVRPVGFNDVVIDVTDA